jgi:hypothetical protein
MKLISTSALAKERDLDPKELFNLLTIKGWIYKKDDKWNLTNDGKLAGGEISLLKITLAEIKNRLFQN